MREELRGSDVSVRSIRARDSQQLLTRFMSAISRWSMLTQNSLLNSLTSWTGSDPHIGLELFTFRVLHQKNMLQDGINGLGSPKY